MNRYMIFSSMALILWGCVSHSASPSAGQVESAESATHLLDGSGFIKDWIIAGTFPNPVVYVRQPDGSHHLGFYEDYLQGIGGEAQAVLSAGMHIEHTDGNGDPVSVVAMPVTSSTGIVDLDALFGYPDSVMAYAFCYVHSDKDQEAWFSLGSDDGVKVWVNGELVHSHYVGRELSLGQDTFSARLRKGNNAILVKVIDMVRDWGFAIEVFDEEATVVEKERQRKKQALIDAMIPEENLLWPNGIENNPVTFEEQNIMKTGSWHPDAPLQISRAYSNVSIPTYFVYPAPPEKNTGVGVVVLPGGGYNDVWLDAEGHGIALHFQELGITSLVVKYRTNTVGEDGKPPLSRDDYLPAATADASEGIRLLRNRAEDLHLDPNKIGVGGFSAGGHLSLSVCTNPGQDDSYPNFAFLIYPWLQADSSEQVAETEGLPPMFIVNGQEDTLTPADVCAEFYATLCRTDVPAELHIYTKGSHGFALGLGQGESAVQWPRSFVAWLKDIDMIPE